MIMINKNHKCKVWINENITSNFPMKRNSWTDAEAISRIIDLMEQKSIRLTLIASLLKDLRASTCFPEAIAMLNAFLTCKGITIPAKLLPAEESERAEDGEERKTNFGTSTIRKIPKFILQLREEKRLFPQTEEKSKNINIKANTNEASMPNKSLSPF
jgi:hypothetical protein